MTEEAKESNGLAAFPCVTTERQHCPSCNTDGEHVFMRVHIDMDGALRPTSFEMWMCATCKHTHRKEPVIKRGSTIDANKAVLERAASATIVDLETRPTAHEIPTLVDLMLPKEARKTGDEINHPAHYNFSKLEVIDVIEAWKLDFVEGSALKYLARAKYKGTQLKCLRKAVWYLNRRITELEAQEKQQATS